MNTAYVRIWGTLAGAVAWDGDSGYGSFEFDPEFVKSGWDIAPLKMPLSSGKTLFSYPEHRVRRDTGDDTFKGLPGLLADSLPDRYGNQLIDIWLASQGRAPDSMNPVEKLCFIGTRGMGALEFEPAILR